ncbi:MAG: ribose 5-phosphate isomerase B [Bacteroidia bacterium]|jgi:ribose 5-phosphate isomerase B|nr:ribose 5-phosphate isomerase B [Bacteroidia bacterium]
MSNIIAIGSDHAGFTLKKQLIQFLTANKYEVLDKGCFSDERADYPDFAHEVAKCVLSHEASMGILLCGSGNGIAMSANKHKGIRAALCWNSEIATLARQHNDANILVLPARYMVPELAYECIQNFLSTGFEGGRHLDRIKKIDF